MNPDARGQFRIGIDERDKGSLPLSFRRESVTIPSNTLETLRAFLLRTLDTVRRAVR